MAASRDRDRSRVISWCLVAATATTGAFAVYAMATGNQALLSQVWDATRLMGATLLGWAIGRPQTGVAG